MVLIRSNTVFVYWLILQITVDENAIREACEETNASLIYDSEEEFQQIEIAEYKLGNRVGPQLIQDHVDNNERDELDSYLQKDLAWAITTGMSSENQNKLINSWTDFNKKVINIKQTKSLHECLPTIAVPPEYSVCKKFLDDLLSLIKELNLDHISAHSDEQVYARLVHIIWKEPQLYKD